MLGFGRDGRILHRLKANDFGVNIKIQVRCNTRKVQGWSSNSEANEDMVVNYLKQSRVTLTVYLY